VASVRAVKIKQDTSTDFVSRNARMPFGTAKSPGRDVRTTAFVSIITSMIPKLDRFAILFDQFPQKTKLIKVRGQERKENEPGE
jgi:CRISPR/Cas system CSM-associated protein Csm2 small subunit